MKLDLDRCPPGRSELEVGLAVSLPQGDNGETTSELAGLLTLDNLTNRMILTGNLSGSLQVECDRCLVPFAQQYEVPVEILILRDTDAEDEPDTCVIHQRIGEVDLTVPLRELAILAMPQKKVCQEECLGICPECGQNLNQGSCSCGADDHDPRWDDLPDG